MMLAIVPLYAALLALLFVALSIRVIKTRRQERVAIGDGDNPRLRRAIGVHNNFAQYVPLALLLLAFVELAAAPILLVHILCLMLLIGRCVHAYGVSQDSENYRLRSIGIWLTFASIALAALYLLVTTLIRLVIAS
jgi:uncharacterized membrane protein YecN with MAPEG domain